MADWYGTCRSNYFRVKDMDAFKALCDEFEAIVITRDDDPTLVGFYSNNFNGSIPDRYTDGIIDPVYITDVISKHLADHEVCIIMTVGAEKKRYVTGEAIAINHDNKRTNVYLDDIYQKSANFFGVPINHITRATY